MQQWRKEHNLFSDGQRVVTLHLHHRLRELLERMDLSRGAQADEDPLRQAGIEEVLPWSYRWEFQGRGTFHVYLVAWVRFTPLALHRGPQILSGKSSDPAANKCALLKYLEQLFNASTDVQCGDGNHCLLKGVTQRFQGVRCIDVQSRRSSRANALETHAQAPLPKGPPCPGDDTRNCNPPIDGRVFPWSDRLPRSRRAALGTSTANNF